MNKLALLGLSLSLLVFCGTGCSSDEDGETLVDGVTMSGKIGDYAYVDLGLSVKWATYNVGADRPIAFGTHFSWGETEKKYSYTESDYKWYDRGSREYVKKYCLDSWYGTVDNKKILDKEDDAAAANWGGTWRMPTHEEVEELINGCIWEFVTDFKGSGTDGALGTSKKNKNTIFLPAAGLLDYNGYRAGMGFYWTASLYNTRRPYDMGFILEDKEVKVYVDYADNGASVRAVSE